MSDKHQKGRGKAGGIAACVMAVIKTLSHGTVPRHLLLQATGREGGKKVGVSDMTRLQLSAFPTQSHFTVYSLQLG